MELRVLRYFLEVAREENITHAAQRLHISQPALSRQLKELEEELGKQLLVRGNHSVRLTEEGMLLRKRAEDILEMVGKTEGDRRRRCPYRVCGIRRDGASGPPGQGTRASVCISTAAIRRICRSGWIGACLILP